MMSSGPFPLLRAIDSDFKISLTVGTDSALAGEGGGASATEKYRSFCELHVSVYERKMA